MVESKLVELVVAGSNPVGHPTFSQQTSSVQFARSGHRDVFKPWRIMASYKQSVAKPFSRRLQQTASRDFNFNGSTRPRRVPNAEETVLSSVMSESCIAFDQKFIERSALAGTKTGDRILLRTITQYVFAIYDFTRETFVLKRVIVIQLSVAIRQTIQSRSEKKTDSVRQELSQKINARLLFVTNISTNVQQVVRADGTHEPFGIFPAEAWSHFFQGKGHKAHVSFAVAQIEFKWNFTL